MRPHSLGGERGSKSVSCCEALCLLKGSGFHQCPEVLVDRLFLGVVRLRKAAQKHCRDSDVLANPIELWRIIPPIHDIALDLADATLGAARRVMRTGRGMVRRARRHMWRLVLPPLS